MDQPNHFAQFGEHAPAIQALFQALLAPMQQQMQQMQQQIAQQPAINAQQIGQAIADAAAQQAAQPPPAQPREPKVADPPIFSGNRSETQSFIRSVRTCFQLTPSRFPPGDETRKILFALGFIQGGTAGAWANNQTNAMLDDEVPNPFATFQAFQNALERAFGSADRAQKARTDMGALKMKPGDTVEEYTTAFEALALHTGYNEAAHIEAYRSGLFPRIRDKIYGDPNGQLPGDLEAWKTKARNLDSLYHELKALQLQSNQGSSNSPRPRQMQARSPSVSTAITNPAPASDAMDVDGNRGKNVKCYNCGKYGHISRFCPEPKKFRSIRAAEIAEVVRAVLTEGSVKQEEKSVEAEADFPNNQQ
jgi:hypothetical protein